MDVAASEFYKEDKSYDLNFKEDVSSFFLLLYCQVLPVGLSRKVMGARYQIRDIKIIGNYKQRLRKHDTKRKQSEIAQKNVD